MYVAKELIEVLEKAMETNEYFNPHIINGVIESIQDGDPDSKNIISNELLNWAYKMWSR